MNEHYQNVYLPKIIRIGKSTCWIGALLVFMPAIVVTFFYHIVPGKTQLMTALIAQISVNAVWWFIEPVSFFQILGVPGSYISFMTGNVSNLRIPCAAAALNASGEHLGTDRGTVISTIGVCASVLVNTTLLVIGVLIGSKLINMLPAAVTDKFSLLLPALFGAVFAQFAVDSVKTAICGVVLAVGSLLCYNYGLFAWFPLDPFIPTIIIPIFGTMIFEKLTFKSVCEDDDQKEEN